MQSSGFRLRFAKCHFDVSSVKYLCLVVDDKANHADPVRIEAFKNFRVPKNAAEVRSFLGLVNYCGKFVDRLHEYKPVLGKLLGY